MKVKSIALGGVLLALAVVLLYGAAVFPAMNLSLFALTSFLGAVMIIESGAKAGILFYIASVLLGGIMVPNLLNILPYAMCFGLYPVIKHWIERLHRRPLEIAIKMLFMNAAFAAMFFLAKEALFSGSQVDRYPIYLIFALLQGAFIAYDLVFSMFTQFYLHRRRKSGF